MPTIDQIYRDNLRQLVKEAGTQEKLSERIGKSPAQISQWINASKDSKSKKPRVLSRQMARAIEKAFPKPDGWMDQQHGEAAQLQPTPGPVKGDVFEVVTPDEHELLEDLRVLDDEDREHMRAEIMKMADKQRARQAKWREQIGIPTAAANARRAKAVKVASTAIDVIRRKSETRTKTLEGPTEADNPELPFSSEPD